MAQEQKQPDRPSLHFILGLPGAGKTTATLQVMRSLDLCEVSWRADDMTQAQHQKEMGSQRLTFMATKNNRVVVLGAYQTEAARRCPELRGPDKYSPPQRTRVKTIIKELAAQRKTRHILFDGLAMLKSGGKPLVEALFETCTVHVYHLKTDREVCRERFTKRNNYMVSEGRLRSFPNRFRLSSTWDTIQKRMDMFMQDKRVHVLQHYVDVDSMCRALEVALRL